MFVNYKQKLIYAKIVKYEITQPFNRVSKHSDLEALSRLLTHIFIKSLFIILTDSECYYFYFPYLYKEFESKVCGI